VDKREREPMSISKTILKVKIMLFIKLDEKWMKPDLSMMTKV
jgi:hypothetical protein